MLVFRGQAGGAHVHFHWPITGELFSLALLMVPVAMPTALAITVSLDFFPKLGSLRALIGAAIAIAALIAILVFAFPVYMSLLDHSNNWQRGMLLPVLVGAAAVLTWAFGRFRAYERACA
jgi:hypothetical protein